jgi:tetratricopeptide (TPR) repeat protein
MKYSLSSLLAKHKGNLPKIIGVVVLIIVVIFIYYYSQKKSSTEKPVVKSPQAVLIENKGLAEFDAENDTIIDVSSQDKKLFEEMMPIFKEMGDGKDIVKNKETVLALGKIAGKYPEYSDVYFLRANISILAADKDYQKMLSDIDNAIRFHSSIKYKSAYDSTVGMYGLRAKVDILSGDYQQAVRDLETAIKTDPSKANDVFNTGGVKPEDDSNPSALHEKDLDLLIAKYPADYRTYMFRGLFYGFFTTFDEKYFSLANKDLKEALKINPQSALINYLLGKSVQKSAFWTKAAWADISDVTGAKGGFREQASEVALNYFKETIKLDPRFIDAYAEVAYSLYSLKRYSEAIPYYDKVIELKPDNAGAYNDRALAKKYINDYYHAISDFSQAIELKKSKPNISLALDNTYENRATAYVKVMNYESAIEDYGRAIGLKFASRVFLMSVPQIREMYPEFTDISDKNLLEGLRQKYFSNMSKTDFSGHYQKNNKPLEDFVIAGLYSSRGDTYLSAGNFKKATNEYARALHAWSDYVPDRWKVISKTSAHEYAVDIQTLDFTQGNIVSLWVKVLNTNSKSYSQQNYQIDCSGRKIKSVSATSYNSVGEVTYTNPTQDWQSIAPESIGEVLYKGMCK